MLLSIEVWQLLTALGAFAGFCIGACAMVGRSLLAQQQKNLDLQFGTISTRLESIEATNREEVNQWRRVEREVMALKSDLPLRFVMRDDYIRGQSIIEAKIDGLAVKLENAQLRGVLGVQKHDN
jgi:hypothetical protein